MSEARVYLDLANILKFSATQLPRYRPRQIPIKWGGKNHVRVVHDPVFENPNERIQNSELKTEAELLPQVAALSEAGLVNFVTSLEAKIEAAGFPDQDSLSGLKERRFLEPQRATGAYQGEGKHNPNQLLDAFHLWCAEHNECDFFLSLDFKLTKIVQQAKKRPAMRVVRPSQLLAAIHGADGNLV